MRKYVPKKLPHFLLPIADETDDNPIMDSELLLCALEFVRRLNASPIIVVNGSTTGAKSTRIGLAWACWAITAI